MLQVRATTQISVVVWNVKLCNPPPLKEANVDAGLLFASAGPRAHIRQEKEG